MPSSGLMQAFERQLLNVKSASPLALPGALQAFIEVAAALLRDQQNRLDSQDKCLMELAKINDRYRDRLNSLNVAL